MNKMVSNNLPVDRGWAWVILFSVTTIMFLYIGTLKSFGIFFVEILDEFKESVSVTSLVNGMQSGVYCIVSVPLLLFGISRFSIRKSVAVGSIMIAVGYGISAFAPKVDFLYFSLSIVVGSGSAFLYSPALVILGKYFVKRRGLATGIAIAAGCLGSVILPPIYRLLLDVYGLRGALILTSGILFHNTALALLLRPLQDLGKRDTKSGTDSSSAVTNGTAKTKMLEITNIDTTKQQRISYKSNINFHRGERFSGSQPVISKSAPLTPLKKERMRTISETNHHTEHSTTEDISSKLSLSSLYKYISLDDVTTMSILSVNEIKTENADEEEEVETKKSVCGNLNFAILKRPSYILFVFVHLFGSIAPALTASFLPVYLKENGLTNDEIVIIVAILSAADFVGRILCGYLADKPWIKKYHVIMITQAITGIVVNCSSMFTTFWPLVVFSILLGLNGGGIFTLVMPVLFDIIGTEQFTSGFAFLIITQGPFLAISTPVFGLIRDQTGNYNASFTFLGCSSLIAALLLFIESLFRKIQDVIKKQKNSHYVEEIESLKPDN